MYQKDIRYLYTHSRAENCVFKREKDIVLRDCIREKGFKTTMSTILILFTDVMKSESSEEMSN